MFYDKLQAVCKQRGTTVTAVVVALGMSRGTMGGWKKGQTPRYSTLKKLADYLGVSINDLLDDEQKEKPADDGGPETLDELREVLRQNGVRILLDADAKDFTPEEIREIANFIKFKRGQRDS